MRSRSAVGGYSTWGRGIATVTGSPVGDTYDVDYEYRFFDRYNWDGGKEVTIFGVHVTDEFMGEFHLQGLAKEFNCFGSIKRKLSWKRGEQISRKQIRTPLGGR